MTLSFRFGSQLSRYEVDVYTVISFIICSTTSNVRTSMNLDIMKSVRMVYPATSVVGFINRAKFTQLAGWRRCLIRKTKHAKTSTSSPCTGNFIQNNNVKELTVSETIDTIHVQLRQPHLEERMGTIYQQETPMFSNRLCLAGLLT